MSSKENAAISQLLGLLESRYAIRVLWALRDGHAPWQRPECQLHFIAGRKLRPREGSGEEAVVLGDEGAVALLQLLLKMVWRVEQQQPDVMLHQLGVGVVADRDADRGSGKIGPV